MIKVEPEPDDWTDPKSVQKIDKQLHHTPPTPEQRALDLVVATLLLVITSPIFVIVIGYYALRSVFVGGSAYPLHTEQRISEGDPFTLYKFRVLRDPTIVEDGENKRVKSYEGGDEETMVGRILVRLYLDELPQIFNVLNGDMRIVGPRPKPVQVAIEERESDGLRRKFLVRPGMTGPDQLRKGYPDRHTAYEGDYRYIYCQQYCGRFQRLYLDLKMLAQTIIPILKAEGK